MNKKVIILLIAVIAILFVSYSVSATETFGDKTCNLGELFPGMTIWFCMNPDGGMDHSFFTYQAMHDYYVPPTTEDIIVPNELIIYSASTETFTVGNMGV